MVMESLTAALSVSLFISAALSVGVAAYAKVTNKRLARLEHNLRLAGKAIDANAGALRIAADRLRIAEAAVDNLRKGYPRVVTGSGTSP